MKAKEIIPKKCERPQTPPAPPHQEVQHNLAPWKKRIIALADAYLSIDDKEDVITDRLRRANAICRIVEDMAMGEDGELSLKALAVVMGIVQEEISVAKLLVEGTSFDL